MTMTLKKKAIFFGFAIFEFVGFVFILAVAAPLQSSDYLSRATLETAPIPDPNKLTVVSFSAVVVGNETRAVIIYDDPATKRPIDYVALYDTTGGLLALTWFDRFGIERLAVDRGLLANTDRPEGIFVAFLTGDSL
jgi:hypothetical protein